MRIRASWWTRVLVAGALAVALPALAQSGDAVSDSECSGCSARSAPASFAGTWSSALTAAAEHGWALADFFCFAACTSEGRARAERLLAGSEAAHRSALELYPEAVAANVRSVERLFAAVDSSRPSLLPGFRCDRAGLAAQVVSPLPLEIKIESDRVLLRYEEHGTERAVSLDAGGAQLLGERAPFGVSKGRFERGVFVVETTGIPAGRLSDWLGGFAHSSELRAVERYSVRADGSWLDLELTLDDPAAIAEPLVVTKSWMRTPHAIMRYGCEVMSAGLSGAFAEYLDPRIIDARRLQR